MPTTTLGGIADALQALPSLNLPISDPATTPATVAACEADVDAAREAGGEGAAVAPAFALSWVLAHSPRRADVERAAGILSRMLAGGEGPSRRDVLYGMLLSRFCRALFSFRRRRVECPLARGPRAATSSTVRV